MLAQFTIALLAIFVAGPLHNEGGKEAVETKGTKAAIETAIAERQPYYSGSLKVSKTGNFGND